MGPAGGKPGLPHAIGLLQPARRAALGAAYDSLRAAGRSREQALGTLAMQEGIAPSFLRTLLPDAEHETGTGGEAPPC